MLNNEIIFILFRLINFLIIILLFVYLFRKYILVGVKAGIVKLQDHFKSLKQRRSDLEILLHEADTSLEDQNKLFNELNSKVKIVEK